MFDVQLGILLKLEETRIGDGIEGYIKEFADPLDKLVRYELHVKGQIEYPNPRTIRAMIKKGILVRDYEDPLLIYLSQPKECNNYTDCKYKGELQHFSKFVSLKNNGMVCKLCESCRDRKSKSKDGIPKNMQDIEMGKVLPTYPLLTGVENENVRIQFCRWWNEEIVPELKLIPIVNL